MATNIHALAESIKAAVDHAKPTDTHDRIVALLDQYGADRFAEGKAAQAVVELRGRDAFLKEVGAKFEAEKTRLRLKIGELELRVDGVQQRYDDAMKAAEGFRAVAEAARPARTDREIVEQTNRLALKFLAAGGFKPLRESNLWESDNPRAKQAWAMACEAQEELTDTDPHDAVQAYIAEREAMHTAPAPETIRPPEPVAIIRQLNEALEEVLAHYDNGDKFDNAEEKRAWEVAGAAQDAAKPFLETRPDPAPDVLGCEECGWKGWAVYIRGDGRKAVQSCDTCQAFADDESAAVQANADGQLCRLTAPCILDGEPDFEAFPLESEEPTPAWRAPGAPNELTIGGQRKTQCTFRRPKDGKRCNRFFLETDTIDVHVHSFTCGAQVLDGAGNPTGETCDLDEGHTQPHASIPF